MILILLTLDSVGVEERGTDVPDSGFSSVNESQYLVDLRTDPEFECFWSKGRVMKDDMAESKSDILLVLIYLDYSLNL